MGPGVQALPESSLPQEEDERTLKPLERRHGQRGWPCQGPAAGPGPRAQGGSGWEGPLLEQDGAGLARDITRPGGAGNVPRLTFRRITQRLGRWGDMHGSRTSSRKRRQQTPEPRQRRPPCGPPSPPARPSRPCSSPPCPGASTGLGWGHRVAGACVSWASLSISTACTPDSWPWRLPLLTRRLSRTRVHVCVSVSRVCTCTRAHPHTPVCAACGCWAWV